MNSFLTTTVGRYFLRRRSATGPLNRAAAVKATYGMAENIPFCIRLYRIE